MTPKQTFYENQAKSIIHKLEARKMEGYYCPDKEAAKAKVLELIGNDKKVVTYGGSMSLDEIGLKEAVEEAGHDLLRREKYVTPEEKRECFAKQTLADVFLMSTNAITLDGELVNIDGSGNRVACLAFGPKEVIVVAGMNKVVTDVEEGVARSRNFAAPPNTVRLGCDTPCAKVGQCGNCLTNTICCQILVTRASSISGRIKVILVGEELGY
ncbi:MAG: lactate utilization protein [Lachnospiraceae bacterium]|nr:lactate utilization protein [Lachnospiraceae bacterium]HCJ07772.1 lactate utilization protein [Lachnospiraceae bacterium]